MINIENEEFRLDPRLEKDCIILGKLKTSWLLLMDNRLIPWFILVPEVNVTELYQLETETDYALTTEINSISAFLATEFNPDKLNVAAIGNIVSQLHIHIVARFKTDFCWPGVVWGISQREAYSKHEVDRIISLLVNNFADKFKQNYEIL